MERRKVKIHLMNLRIRHYQYTLWLSFITIIYAISLWMNTENVISRVVWFNKNIDNWIAMAMVIAAVFKISAILLEWKRIKKLALLGLLSSWLLIFWAYLNSPIQNNSWVMAIAIIGFCYIALYRGDFSE